MAQIYQLVIWLPCFAATPVKNGLGTKKQVPLILDKWHNLSEIMMMIKDDNRSENVECVKSDLQMFG